MAVMRWMMPVALGLSSALPAAETRCNPYCVSGANWSAKGVMDKLGMPGGATNPNGSLAYIWDALQPTNLANMVRPKRYYEYVKVDPARAQAYDHTTDTIHDPAAFGKWVEENPGKVWIIGNEQNHEPQDGLKPAEYARMFHKYYDFIKVQGRDPKARFATGACLAIAEPAWIKNVTKYWDEALAEYRKQFSADMPVDIWNNHCYAYVGELDPDRIIEVFFKPFREYVDTVSGGIYADKEVWCTEFGVGLWATPLHPDYVAEYIRQLCPRFEQEYKLSTGKTKRVVDRWFWFIGPWVKDMYQDSSLLGPDGKPTAPGQAYVTLARGYPNHVPRPPAAPKPASRRVKSVFYKNAYPWRPVAGNWKVEDEILRHTRPDDPKFRTQIHLPYWYRDFRIEADVRIDKSDDPKNWAGFFLRHGTIWKDGQQGYAVVIRQNGQVALTSTKAGEIKAVADAVADTSAFHRLGAGVAGSHFEVTLDGKTLITWDDAENFRREGFVSLSAGKTDCSFDNVEVTLPEDEKP